MNKRRFFIPMMLATVLVSSMIFAFPTFGQEATQESQPTPIICESSLILLVGLAQRDYGFQSSMDTSQLERGQYGQLYDDSGMGTDDMMMTEEAPMTDDMGMDASATQEAEMSSPSAVFLNPPVVLDEDTRCTQLRSDVERFFSDRMQSGEMGQNDSSN